MRTFILILGIWTLLEGSFALIFPRRACQLAGAISKTLKSYLDAQDMKDIRLLGLFESIFGLGLLLLYQFGPR